WPRLGPTIPAPVPHHASTRILAAAARRSALARLRLAHRFDDGAAPVHYRVIDHLAVDLDRGRAARLGLAGRGGDAVGAGQLPVAGQIGGIDRADLVRMHA